ncbi:MAG: hypothetical protein QGI24_10575, partial [Kiritimatiellia bacterium]|nr:hypothetical protein [Kiritimatiellia bacterium]
MTLVHSLGYAALSVLIMLPAMAPGAGDRHLVLMDLARREFGSLSKTEAYLIRSATDGDPGGTMLDEGREEIPGDGELQDRRVPARTVVWLCTDPTASQMVTQRGIWFDGLQIDGRVDLRLAKISFPLLFRNCTLPEGMDISGTELRALHFLDSSCGPVAASGVKIEQSLILRGCQFDGGFNLVSAQVGVALDLRGTQLMRPGDEGIALAASWIKVGRTVFMGEGTEVVGEVNFDGAEVGGSFECLGARFTNGVEALRAISAKGINVHDSVIIAGEGLVAFGGVDFGSAKVTGRFNCSGRILNPYGPAIVADRIMVEGGMQLAQDFEAIGGVSIEGASIGGTLDCRGGRFLNEEGVALNAARIQVGASVLLRDNLEALGAVQLSGASIDADLDCHTGRFMNPDGFALVMNEIRVGNSVRLDDGFHAKGEVSIVAGRIGGHLVCNAGVFDGNPGSSFAARDLKVGGSVHLENGFRAAGTVDFSGAVVDGFFTMLSVGRVEGMSLDLRSASVGTLWDDEQSWPEPGNLMLQGFIYDVIHDKAPVGAWPRISWLERQPSDSFKAQPYEQLAKVLRKGGHEAQARTVMIARNRERCRYPMTVPQWCWYGVFGPIIGYGYQAWKALWIVLGFFLLGGVLFGGGYQLHLITPSHGYEWRHDTENNETHPPHYPRFNFLVYSIDAFVPLIDLHQAKYWLPSANRGRVMLRLGDYRVRMGGVLLTYFWIHIVAGWTTIILL